MTAKNPEPIIMGIFLQPNRFNEGKKPFNPTLFEMEIQKKKKERENILSITRPKRRMFKKGCCCCVASVVSDSVRPHKPQPTRLPRPWDSPGKNTGVSCHFLLQCMKLKSESEDAQLCPTLSDPMDCSLPGSPHPWDFPGKSTGVGCH